MQQFASLAQEAGTDIDKLLPEEALTQIYQAGLLFAELQSCIFELARPKSSFHSNLPVQKISNCTQFHKNMRQPCKGRGTGRSISNADVRPCSSQNKGNKYCLMIQGFNLLQCYLLLQVDEPEAKLGMPEGLLEKAQSQWTASCLKVCVSQLHNDVAEALRALGLSITIEQLTADKLFSIDIALPGKLLFD